MRNLHSLLLIDCSPTSPTEGVVKDLVALTLEDLDDAAKLQMRDIISSINSVLPPGSSSMKLQPDFIKYHSRGKAADFLSLVRYYAPIVFFNIDGISQQRYQLWLDLTRLCSLIFAYELTPDEINDIEQQAVQYVTNFIEEFPDKTVKFNYHLLLHVARSIRIFGPSFVTWCFGFERGMGRICHQPFSGSTHGLLITLLKSYTAAWRLRWSIMRAFAENATAPSGTPLERIFLKLEASPACNSSQCRTLYTSTIQHRIFHQTRPCTGIIPGTPPFDMFDEIEASRMVHFLGAASNLHSTRVGLSSYLDMHITPATLRMRADGASWAVGLRVFLQRMIAHYPSFQHAVPHATAITVKVVDGLRLAINDARFRGDRDYIKVQREDGTARYGKIKSFLHVSLICPDVS